MEPREPYNSWAQRYPPGPSQDMIEHALPQGAINTELYSRINNNSKKKKKKKVNYVLIEYEKIYWTNDKLFHSSHEGR